MSNKLDICKKAVALALKLGASDASSSLGVTNAMGVSVFEGKSDGVEGNIDCGISFTAHVGQKVASGSTENLTDDSVESLVRTIVEAAKQAPEDPFACVADKSLIQPVSADMIKYLDLVDSTEHTADEMLQMACEMEAAARSIAGVASIRSADVSSSQYEHYLVISNGFEGHYKTSSRSAVIQAMAELNGEKVINYDYDSARHWSDIRPMASIGIKSGEKAAAMLNQVSMGHKGVLPVVLDPKISVKLLLGTLQSCLHGGNIVAKGSFINKDDLGTKLFGDNINLLDNRTKVRGLGSSPYAGSGIIGPESVNLVKNGNVENFLLGLRNAKQLGLSPKLGRPSLYNPYFEGGTLSPDDLIDNIKLGLYVTNVMGHGFKAITGDISYTVAGFVIRDGVITGEYVKEASLAGNLKDMLNETTFANDLKFNDSANAATARIEGVSIVG